MGYKAFASMGIAIIGSEKTTSVLAQGLALAGNGAQHRRQKLGTKSTSVLRRMKAYSLISFRRNFPAFM